MNTSNISIRMDYLDAVRAFALLLGIVFHASMSFMPIFIGWAVMDISTSLVVAQFLQVSHSFRMELFFLMAGFFSHMTFHRKGAKAFLNSRLTRIALPFVVGWFILKPLVNAAWMMGGQSMQGEIEVWNSVKTGFLALRELPVGIFVGSHLWFLYYLILITALALGVRALVCLSPTLRAHAIRRVDTVVRWIASSRFSLIILAIPTAACLWFMSMWGMDTPDKSLAPHWPVLLVYGGFFSLGWLLHRQEGLIEQLGRLSTARTILSIVSIGALIVLSGYQANMGHPQFELIRAVFVFSYAMTMWSLVCLTIGLFRRLFNQPNKLVRYIADASYWLYLIHLPIVIWLQIAFAELPIHWSLKIPAISLLTVGISLVLYDLLVRPTLIGQILNGRRKDRVLFGGRPKDTRKGFTGAPRQAPTAST